MFFLSKTNITKDIRRTNSEEFKLISYNGINAGEEIPVKYCKKGSNLNPPLKWEGAPENTKSYAISVMDPDAPVGTWIHWEIVNIPANTTSIQEGCKGNSCGGLQLLNSWHKAAKYDGPQPPSGTHRYIFTVYA